MEESLLFIIDLLKITVPALIVAFAMYYLVKKHYERDYKIRLLELRQKNSEVVVPIRLQAYERVVLLLERITPSNLLVRVSGAGHTAAEYHRVLLAEIRNEFNHNLSQQVYMTEQAWQQVKHAREDVVNLINKTYQELPEGARGTELAKRILETVLNTEQDPTERALSYVKQEIGQTF
ncbi:hypothetical protein CLV24_11018 [Pontibacter ummariensis]|uniref:Uncharacterized protein n=1 Tax=Pontibacter ummariensis TaxID=1610492 RepID=A0A239GAC5_9BACT|nr:hypothetical protein [Pontibacter ummariensis]PRY11573.1 hypothetical protein CLV24_11018 [Pontibacter ummariensis]SNS65885.1 hypothetical protein SAMN06296052_110130 [Pontibacter ummariensis]